MAMTSYKVTRSQIALSLLASLLTLTPLFSSSLRLTYIYFIFNLLIIALGAEAGLLSSLLSNPNSNPNPNPNNYDNEKSPEEKDSEFLQKKDEIRKMESRTFQKLCSSQIVASAAKKIVQVIKSPSITPSIFFIGEVELQQDRDLQRVEFEIRDKDDEEEEERGVVEGKELFTMSENFIGNFYKQLDLQRDEDSWNKTHGFYIVS